MSRLACFLLLLTAHVGAHSVSDVFRRAAADFRPLLSTNFVRDALFDFSHTIQPLLDDDGRLPHDVCVEKHREAIEIYESRIIRDVSDAKPVTRAIADVSSALLTELRSTDVCDLPMNIDQIDERHLDAAPALLAGAIAHYGRSLCPVCSVLTGIVRGKIDGHVEELRKTLLQGGADETELNKLLERVEALLLPKNACDMLLPDCSSNNNVALPNEIVDMMYAAGIHPSQLKTNATMPATTPSSRPPFSNFTSCLFCSTCETVMGLFHKDVIVKYQIPELIVDIGDLGCEALSKIVFNTTEAACKDAFNRLSQIVDLLTSPMELCPLVGQPLKFHCYTWSTPDYRGCARALCDWAVYSKNAFFERIIKAVCNAITEGPP